MRGRMPASIAARAVCYRSWLAAASIFCIASSTFSRELNALIRT